MAGSKKKKKNKRRRSAAGVSDLNPGWSDSQTPLHQRSDRHALIAMTLASLVAGLLVMVNLDRAAHADSLTKEERMVSTSRHGWPLVYLERRLEAAPKLYFAKRIYSWPVPAVDGELRVWQSGNLAGNAGIGVAIVVGAYWLISFAVRRYERWKASLKI